MTDKRTENEKDPKRKRDQDKDRLSEEDRIDEAVEESFPASDPPSTSAPDRDKG